MNPQDTQQTADQLSQNQQADPGPVSYTPKGAEGMGSYPSYETAPIVPEVEQTPEFEPSIETEISIPQQTQQQEAPKEQVQEIVTTPQQPPKIVDKSHEPLNLHHLQNPLDKLTTRADQEEEDFITQVESIHEHR